MYKECVSPVLDRFDSEKTHALAQGLMHFAESTPLTLKFLELFAYKRKRYSHEKLRTEIGGIEFENPLLAGAGCDKAGRIVRALWQLGFGGVEIGSVLARPQPGNQKPRQFIIGRGVALNRLGFNSKGVVGAFSNLKRYARSNIPIGISVGKNEDVEEINAHVAYSLVVKWLYNHGSYFVINVSSPNTLGLRDLQGKEPLTKIVLSVIEAMQNRGGRKPLFVKVSPELTNRTIDDVIEVALDNGLTGIVATNTTASPVVKAKYGERWSREDGGLSGDDPDFREMSTQMIRYIYKAAGDRLKIIGVGGIKDSATALEKIMAGASLIQVVTALRGEGPTVAGRINRGLVEFMDREGVKSIQDLVGASF